MIKLPDYSQCFELKTLLLNMGIKEISGRTIVEALPEVKFERPCQKKVERVVPNTEQLRFAQEIKTHALLFVQLKEQFLQFEENASLEVNGVKCCAYINKGAEHKYHLFCCATIKGMLASGDYGKYVCTSRDDGWFPVFFKNKGWVREDLVRLEICQYCVSILRQRSMYRQCFSDEKFSLKLFYQKCQPEIPETTTRVEFVLGTEEYAPSHQELADRYKKECNYTCQLCKVHVEQFEDRKYLHMHHIDRNKKNNKRENLMILCVICHSEQPRHRHMVKDSEWEPGFPKIVELRKKQGLPLPLFRSG